MITPQVIKVKNYIILHDVSWKVAVPDKWFHIEYWQEQKAVIGQAVGRGTAWFVRADDTELVLRHYMRGGLVAKLLGDRYLWLGLKWSRAWREWHLLMDMHQQGLPVPQPLAARITKQGGIFYTADLLTKKIPNTKSLTQALEEGELDEVVWQRIGETIARFHKAGIYHADLNANNILLDDQYQVFIIDFDRGEKRSMDKWRFDNLSRLLRSLYKQQGLAKAEFHFSQTDWQALYNAYEQFS